MSKPEIFDARDRRFMRDMNREMARDVELRPDPATKAITCKCGHTLAQHYQGTMAMPCGKCACAWCSAPRAEDVRKQRARLRVQDITPHPDFRKRR